MSPIYLLIALLIVAMTPAAAWAEPLVIGHRGASGERPEHTAAAYRLAADQGAHLLETDLVMTRDGVLICRHEPALAIVDEATGKLKYRTTDVADRPEFADRLRTAEIDGKLMTGWFAQDFTAEELQSLRAVEPLPDLRAASAAYDGRYALVTLSEFLELAEDVGVGVLIELKHPLYFREIGLPMEEAVVEALENFEGEAILQSFDASSLRRLDALTTLPLVLLTSNERHVTPAALADASAYADGVGVHKKLASRTLIENARLHGLGVYVWTLRAEQTYLPAGLPDIETEAKRLVAMGVDGLITDHPARVVAGIASQ